MGPSGGGKRGDTIRAFRDSLGSLISGHGEGIKWGSVAGVAQMMVNVVNGVGKDKDAIFKKAVDYNALFRSLPAADRSTLRRIVTKYDEFMAPDFTRYLVSMFKLDAPRAKKLLKPLIENEPGEKTLATSLKIIKRFFKGNPRGLWDNVAMTAGAAAIGGSVLWGVKKAYYKWAEVKVPKDWKYKEATPRPRPKSRPKPRPKPRAAPKPVPKKRKKRVAGQVASGPGEKGTVKPDDLLALFRRLDVDDSGRLDQSELGPLARRMNMTPGELLRAMDKDGDKGVTYAEFRRFMRGARSGGYRPSKQRQRGRG